MTNVASDVAPQASEPKMSPEEAVQLNKYLGEVKKALKTMSKNELIRTVGALLLDKQLMMQEINRLNSQKESTNEINSVTAPADSLPSQG
jgi:hypothetical protein